MYCDPQLKLNKFRFVRIPRPSDYVQRFGLHDVNGSYSSEPLPRDNRKTSVMSRLVAFNASDVRSAELKAMQDAAARAAEEAANAGV